MSESLLESSRVRFLLRAVGVALGERLESSESHDPPRPRLVRPVRYRSFKTLAAARAYAARSPLQGTRIRSRPMTARRRVWQVWA